MSITARLIGWVVLAILNAAIIGGLWGFFQLCRQIDWARWW